MTVLLEYPDRIFSGCGCFLLYKLLMFALILFYVDKSSLQWVVHLLNSFFYMVCPLEVKTLVEFLLQKINHAIFTKVEFSFISLSSLIPCF